MIKDEEDQVEIVVLTKEEDTRMFLKLSAKLISIVTNPILTLGVASVIILRSYIHSNWSVFLAILLASFASSILVYLVTLLSYQGNLFKYIDLDRNKRVYILFSLSLSSIIAAGLFTLEDYSIEVQKLFLIFSILFGLSGILTLFFTKVSMHTLAVSFLIVCAIPSNIIFSIIGLFALPFVYFARIKLLKHTPLQLFLGVIEGFFLGVFVVL